MLAISITRLSPREACCSRDSEDAEARTIRTWGGRRCRNSSWSTADSTSRGALQLAKMPEELAMDGDLRVVPP